MHGSWCAEAGLYQLVRALTGPGLPLPLEKLQEHQDNLRMWGRASSPAQLKTTKPCLPTRGDRGERQGWAWEENLGDGKARGAPISLLPVRFGAGFTLLLPTPILSDSPAAELQTQRHLWFLLPFYLHISSFLHYYFLCVKNLPEVKVHSCQKPNKFNPQARL